MSLFTRLADKAGLIGSVVSAAAWVNCFPALASLGAAIGLGVPSPYEGLIVRILLPAFADIALLANALG
jgi:mercuric ion transport protein